MMQQPRGLRRRPVGMSEVKSSGNAVTDAAIVGDVAVLLVDSKSDFAHSSSWWGFFISISSESVPGLVRISTSQDTFDDSFRQHHIPIGADHAVPIARRRPLGNPAPLLVGLEPPAADPL